MDLQRFEASLREVGDKQMQMRRFVNSTAEDLKHKLGHDDYTEDDLNREISALYQEQFGDYNSRLVLRPLLNEAIAAYEVVSVEERSAIREIFAGVYLNGLLEYIIECAECLETPEDEDVFRLGLIAASIDNYASDYRDTDMILTELAIAAVKAGINVEPHCTAVAQLSCETPGFGGVFMKAKLEIFHIYAPKAVRPFPYNWVEGIELPDDGRESW